MSYQVIPWILGLEEETEFQSATQKWRPKNLLQIRQAQLLLADVRSRRDNLDLARDELVTLEYADRYIKYLRRMRIWVRDASFSWKADQLKFIVSIVGFYSDYGAVLRLLRNDQLAGKFSDRGSQSVSL